MLEQKLVSFFSTLRTAMRAVAPGATLTYPIDGFFNPSWSTRFASIPALAQAVDHVFLMCCACKNVFAAFEGLKEAAGR